MVHKYLALCTTDVSIKGNLSTSLSVLSELSTRIRLGPETSLLEGGSFASKRDRVDTAFVIGAWDDSEVLCFMASPFFVSATVEVLSLEDDEALSFAVDLRFPLSSRLFSFSVWLVASHSAALEDD